MSGAQSQPNSFVLLQIGNRRFALPSASVAELAPPVRLHTFPNRSALIAGVIVRRGHIVPVYDAGPILIGRESPSHRFYLIVRRNFGNLTEPSAIPVNGECELVNIELQPADAGHPAYVCGKLVMEDEQIPVLDLDRLVTMSLNSDSLTAEPATTGGIEARQ